MCLKPKWTCPLALRAALAYSIRLLTNTISVGFLSNALTSMVESGVTGDDMGSRSNIGVPTSEISEVGE